MAVVGLQAAAQFAPALDFMHGLVGDDFFEDVRGRGPVYRFHQQEAAVEPRVEQVMEIGIDTFQLGLLAHRAEQVLAYLDQPAGTAGGEVDPPQQFLPVRLGGRGYAQQVGRVGTSLVAFHRVPDLGHIDVEVGEQQVEKLQAAGVVELFVGVQDPFREQQARVLAIGVHHHVAERLETLGFFVEQVLAYRRRRPAADSQ